MNIVKRFRDLSFVYYDRGKFDDWCVYLNFRNEKVFAPRDEKCFEVFLELSIIYGKERVYRDFCNIYNKTSSQVEKSVLDMITELSFIYDKDNSVRFDIWMTILYMAMVAEENKKNTVLRKRIKRLGLHQVLFENLSVTEAANFSKGKKVFDLNKLCLERGF